MPTRVILERYQEQPSSLCWREAWASRYDSAYVLLSKFALLNAFVASDLAVLFVARGKGLRNRIRSAPNLSLIDASNYDLPLLSKHLKLSDDGVKEAFIDEELSASGCSISQDLRFCPACLKRGFHTAIYQLDMLIRCPIHGCKLASRCPHCKLRIPYRLQSRLFSSPFCCPGCKTLLTKDFSNGKDKPHVLTNDEQLMIGNVIDLLRLKQHIFTCSADIEKHFSFYDNAQYRIARPLLERKKEDYFSFLEAVISRWSTPNSGVMEEAGAGVSWILHSEYVPKLKPGFRAKASPGTLTESRRNWYERDDKFWSLMPIYKAIRRHIWRRIVRNHKSCARVVARALWWSPQDRRTPPTCPVAYAFLQWRSFWEGYGAPQQLFLQPVHAPLRLLAWLGDTAPMCSYQWPQSVQDWLTQRVFALDCINSFYEWAGIARRMSRRKSCDWSRSLCTGHAMSYWAAAAEGSGANLMLAIEQPDANCMGWFENYPFDSAHRRWQKSQAAVISAMPAQHMAGLR